MKLGTLPGRGQPHADPGPGPAPADDVRRGVILLTVAAVAAAVTVFAGLSALPPNPLSPPASARSVADQLLPEGWAFFTASPQTVYTQVAFLRAGGRWQVENHSLVVPGDLFGLDRSKRAQGTAIALLLRNVSPAAWHRCTRTPTRCLASLPAGPVIQNTSNLRSICGQVGFIRQQMLPWAWRYFNVTMPSTVMRAEVRC